MLGRSLAALIAISLFASPASGQENPFRSQWRAQIGAGPGFHVACKECEADPFGLGLSAGIERRLGSRHRLVLSWMGVWLDGDMGKLSRHSLSIDLILVGSSAGTPFLRLGVGPTLSTEVSVDGPPDPPGVGDVLIGIGDTGGLGVTAGTGFDYALTSRLSLVPELRFTLQRVNGEVIGAGVFLVSLGLG